MDWQGIGTFGELRGGLGQALVVPPDPPDEAAVADLDLLREVEGLVLELAARCELAADRLGARVVVDVLGALAAAVYRDPSRSLTVIGITGTSGNPWRSRICRQTRGIPALTTSTGIRGTHAANNACQPA